MSELGIGYPPSEGGNLSVGSKAVARPASVVSNANSAASKAASTALPDAFGWGSEAIPRTGSKSGSRAPSIAGMDPEAGTEPVPQALSREGSRTSARPTSALSNHSARSSVGRKSFSNKSTADVQEPALPWAAPTEPAPSSRAGSVIGLEPELGHESPRIPSREASKASVRAPSVALSTGSNGSHRNDPKPSSRAASVVSAVVAPEASGLEPSPRVPSRESSKLSAGGASAAAPPSHRSASNHSFGKKSSAADAQELRPEALPWNDPKPDSRPPSAINVTEPGYNDDAPPSRGLGGLASPAASVALSQRSGIHKSASNKSAVSVLDSATLSQHDQESGSRPASAASVPGPEAGYESPRALSRTGSKLSARPSSVLSHSSVANSISRNSTSHKSTAATQDTGPEPLPWSAQALEEYRGLMRNRNFKLLDPADEPLTARLDAVFSLPSELWPVLPPGAMYCLDTFDPRSSFGYLQHSDFPDTKVRVGTYFGKWGRQLVDYVVAWQPTPRAEAAWQPGDSKTQPPLPWEPRQVVAHTTNGEYQYSNTRMRFRGPKAVQPDAEVVEWCDAHGVDLLDTKAANETAVRNSDKDRDAHLLDPPRPNTWGELARRPLIGNMRSRGGGAYVHHVNYDHSGLRTSCGRRVPAGYFFTLVPNAPAKTPAVPGGPVRAVSAGRSVYRPEARSRVAAAIADANASRLDSVYALLRNANPAVQALLTGVLESAEMAPGGLAASARPSSAGARPMSAGARPLSVGSRRPTSAGSPPGSSRLPLLGGPALGATLPLDSFKSGWSAAPPLQREGSKLPTATFPTLVTLGQKQRWRTYDVPFNHPIHVARAQDLGTAMAVASGTGVRTFSDAAAVMKVAEQEMRLPRAFVPGPLVVPSWEDVPRLYAEHMAAAKALMPVTELDNYASSKLHMLLHHLQHAATLEYDRLDAKLALLPQMARLGRKSAEIDAWLQVIVEHASYLYDKLQITDTARWSGGGRQSMRRSVTFARTAPLVSPTASSWNFPDPLMGTSFAGHSALNVAARPQSQPLGPQMPAHILTVEEWAGVTKVMDTCRHAVLYDHWVRLRPLMTGAAQPGAYSASRPNSTMAASSDACATATGDGERPAAPEPYSHGVINRELLDYVHADMQAMTAGTYTPPPASSAAVPVSKGYHGEGPLPAELVAEMPQVHRPVRCRGNEETPLPEEFNGMDLWNINSKADQASPRLGSPDVPSPLDAGALRFSQVSVHRLQAAKGFAESRQAEVRRSMQRAKGQVVWDEPDVPEYGSDIAEDCEVMSVASGKTGKSIDGMPRRRRRHGPAALVTSSIPGIATQTCDEEGLTAEEQDAMDVDKAAVAAEAAETRRLLLTGNGGKTREQVLEEAIKAADVAIQSLQPHAIGTTPLSAPDSPRGFLDNGESVDTAWKPFGVGPEPYSRGLDPQAPRPKDDFLGGRAPEMFQRRIPESRGRATESYGRGPEPFSLEKLTAEPSVMSEAETVSRDIPKTNAHSFGGVNIGIGGLVDYETAMARRRAIAGAEVAHDRSDFIPKSEVLTLFVTYCNLGSHPELVEMLQRAIEAPVSEVTMTAVAKAVSATASRNATAAARADTEVEAARQRIRATAWLLGVTWRRITNETYTSFLCRVMGWPMELAASLHRTRCTQMIARALVRGHDMGQVPKLPPRH